MSGVMESDKDDIEYVYLNMGIFDCNMLIIHFMILEMFMVILNP